MKCLCELYTEQGLLEKSSGLLINRPGIFCLENREQERLFVNLAARIGVECSGMKRPVCKSEPELAVRLSRNQELGAGNGRILLSCGGVLAEAGSQRDLESLTEYLVCRFPEAPGGNVRRLREHLAEAFSAEICVEEVRIHFPEGRITGVVYREDGSRKELDEEWLEKLAADFGDSKEEDSCKSYDALKPGLSQNLNKRIHMEKAHILDADSLLSLALSISLRNFETVYPLAAAESTDDAEGIEYLRFQEEDTARILFQGNDTVFAGSKETLPELLSSWMERSEELRDQNWLEDLSALAGGRKEVGQAAAFLTGKEKAEKQAELVTREYTAGIMDETSFERYLTERTGVPVDVKKCQTGREVKRWNFTPVWEGKEFWEKFSQKALPFFSKGDVVEISGRLSEDADVRRRMEKRLCDAVEAAGARADHVSVCRSFKSGSCWIEESVLPRLKMLGDIKRIEIDFSYFVNELGEEEFEDESAPNYGEHQDKPHKWFDIPTRWLQELFPVDEVLADGLSISTDAVAFRRADDLGHTYRIRAYGAEDAEVFSDTFDVKYVEKYYMNRYPVIGKTHVTTGWIIVKKNGRILLDEQVETDTERIWTAMEDTVLPDLEKLLTDKYTVDGLVGAQPLFNRLQLNISMSEVDYDTGIREERVSTTENMQEDMYFYLLDWFKTFGERECGRGLDNVGLIIPEIKNVKEEDSRFEVILYEDYAEEPYGSFDGKICPIEQEKVKAEPVSLHFEGDTAVLLMEIRTEGEEIQNSCASSALSRLRVAGELLEKGILNYCPDTPWRLIYKGCGEEAVLDILPAGEKASVLKEEEKDRILREDVIDYAGYKELLTYYSRYPELKIRPVETTYQGRKIFYIEYIKKDAGILYARNKLMTNRLMILFNGRHHGNEASSVNSAFLLLDRLLKDESLRDQMDTVNVLTLPWENIDGGELHCTVQKENPKWLCHPARYNSAGFEFRKDYNNPDTIYGESRAVVKLWRKWLFDVVTDNHGFEGHELVQPFSGYISPWYKGFWIPKALYYGYIWFDESNPYTISFGNRVRSKVADYINEDQEIWERNKVCQERFYKYAEKWFPTMFRTETYKDVIFYWIETNKQKRANNFNLSNPEITTLDWTTEVADETVTGDDMWLNARAHLLSDLALFEVLKETDLISECRVSERHGHYTYTKFRRRPLM
ncbi:M14 family metallopeptidase [Lacrimispora sp. NSJ-141]|uniref:M14 family metallopeptidase n=1 Tax=Lientehia hominis TaxID=2897778 RepID=A0AAP2W6B9_9FIRM|nr:M14 family metallopeptidase [Lientehia hominis]